MDRHTAISVVPIMSETNIMTVPLIGAALDVPPGVGVEAFPGVTAVRLELSVTAACNAAIAHDIRWMTS